MKKVYLIECNNGFSSSYKIGYTTNIDKRIKQLSTGNPGNFTKVKEYSTENASSLEAYLHRYFSSRLIKNEWFDLDYTDIDTFLDICARYEKNIALLKSYGNPFSNI